MAIGFVYEHLPFTSKETNEQKQNESDKYREFLAEAIADTAAILPRYGPIYAGALRATLLLRPTDSVTENVKSFASNFAEGAALKKVSALALPEGHLSSRYSQSLAFSAQGFAFGSVKSAFNKDTWFADDGSFSPGKASFRVISSGLFSAAVNVPLSHIGGKITGAVIDKTSASGLGAKSSLLAGSLVSGYGTGFLLGSTNAFVEGKSAADIFASGNEAGILSSLTGAAIVGASPLRFSAVELPAARDVVRVVARNSKGRPDEPSTSNHEFKVPMLSPERLLGLNRNRQPLSAEEVIAQSSKYELVTQPQRVLNEDLRLGTVPLFSERAYLYWTTSKESWQQRIYAGDSKMMGPMYVKHDYASELDAQLLAMKKNNASFPTEHHIEIRQAFLQTPDPSLIKRIDVRPDKNVFTLWHRRINRDPFMDILATARWKSGEISMNLRGKSANVNETADHEWAHLLEPKVPKERALFEAAAAIERKGYYVSDYSKKDSGENWAEHSASFLGNKFNFLDFVHGAPLRAVALSQGIARASQNSERILAGSTDGGLKNRIQYVQEEVLPGALKNLKSRMSSSDQLEATRATLMYGALAREDNLPMLNDAAAGSKFLRAAAYSALAARLNNDQFTARGYENVQTANKQKELNKFLSFHLNPDNKSYSRHYALEGLANHSSTTNLSAIIASEQKELRRFFGDALYLVLK